MRVEYKRLFKLLVDKDIPVAELRKDTGLSTCTFTRLRRNEPVTISVLLKIAEYLHCDIAQMCEFVEDKQPKRKAGDAQ
ncbi:MAG: helix-turn-helix transcriptional regulator [Eubacteriales bacterium]|nr:helix-turn-helix transcriptional regulator [Eubacteriales bacterium]